MPNAVLMISVLSISPTTISTVCARRRGMLRRPMKNITRLRSTIQPIVAAATARITSKAIMM